MYRKLLSPVLFREAVHVCVQYAPLEKFRWISLYMTDDANAKLFVT